LLECRVDATGAYTSLGRFLFEVEKSPLALRLESIDLSSRDETGQKISLSLVVTGLRLAPLEGKL
jgi:Tfp pilus assembly protein PilO